MKILHVINSMDMGGAQSLLVELLPAQKRIGHDVSVLQLVDSSDRTLIKKLIEKDIKVMSLSKGRSVRNVINIFALLSYFREYDIIHAHLFPANYWVACAKLLSRNRTPIVTTEHSTDNKRRKIRMFRYIDAFFYKRYQLVIACADIAMNSFVERYKGIQCISIPNGVDISQYICAIPYTKMELLGIPEDCFVLTMVARFIPSKRQDVVVKAISALPSKYHAVFVGGKRNDKGLIEVLNLAQELGVSERVHFLYIRSDVPRILKSSDIVIMSSEYEGLSLSSIEGMASGHPFVASDVKGLREVVSGAGVLVKCGDSVALAETIRKLCEDERYKDSVVSKCLKRSSQFDISNVAKNYIDVYRQIVEKYG